MFNVLNSQILIFYLNFLVFPNIGDIIFITQTSKGANKMAKYFKATVSPKKGYLKTNPDAADIILATNESGTQAEFKEALIAMLDEEGMTNDYFAPKIERCTEEEFNFINADDGEDAQEETPEVVITSSGPVTIESESLISDDESSEHSGFNVDDQTGEVKSDEQQEVYRYFEFEKGYAAIIKTEFEIFSGKWLGSFTYLRNRYHHQLENQFSSDENAAVNAIGSLIDHLNSIKNEVEDSGVTVGTWYKKTVMGLASDGEGRLIHSIITKGEYDTIMNQPPLPALESDEEEPSIDEKFKLIFDSVTNHAEFSKVAAGGDFGKISENIEEMFSEATEGQINMASETIDAMRDIKRLTNPEEFAEIFAFIFEDKKQELPDFKYPAVYDAVAKLCLDSGVTPGEAYLSLEKVIPEGSEDSKISEEVELLSPPAEKLISNPDSVVQAIVGIKTKAAMEKAFTSVSNAFANVGISLTKKAEEPKPEVKEERKETGDWLSELASPKQEAEKEPKPEVKEERKETGDWLSELASPKQEAEKEPEQSDFDKQVAELNAKLDALELGERLVKEDLPNDVYHACNGISSTKLKVAMSSLMKFDAKYVSKTIPEQDKTDYFDLGKLFHTMTLEPHLVDVEYFREPEGLKAPTKPQRDKYNAWLELGKPSKKDNAKAYPTDLMIDVCEKEDQMISDAAGRCIVSNENWLKAEAMAKAVRDDADSGRLVKAPNLRCETSYFKRDEDTGLIIKCRPDAELGAIVADLKSISLRSEPDEENLINKLRWEVIQRGYHVSAAMYLEITGKSQFIWIFTGTQEGYHWNAPVMASEKILDEGRQKYRYYLSMIAMGYETGEWAKPTSVQIRYENNKAVIPEI
ncbi:TMhelix containing protein [Vibrio phage 1.154.O._10N.222.52.B12]|nr:TMhelix containing protein [Vibrio phage 1.154.O._10N.222.52.B12]